MGETLLHKPQPQRSSVVQGDRVTGQRRRFELALLLATVAQHPPRRTHGGRIHAADSARLASILAPLGLTARSLERRLEAWMELGIAHDEDGCLQVLPSAFSDIPRVFLLLALAQLVAPSVPVGALQIVGRLLAANRPLALREALDGATSDILRDRADDEEEHARGARSELLEVGQSLLALDCVVLHDSHGHALTLNDGPGAGEHSALLALDGVVAEALRGKPLSTPAYGRGHVQSSYELVTDSACDPTLVARIALWSKLERADRAAVYKLERAAGANARALGFTVRDLMDDLTNIGGHPVPGNVAAVLRDWFGDAGDAPRRRSDRLPEIELLALAARNAIGREAADTESDSLEL